jgi:hypothetical protein
MSRKFLEPREVGVRADAAGAPRWLRWRGRLEGLRVCNRWRSGGAWWRDEAPREYFRVLTRSQTLLVLYRDGANGRWYVEEICD